MRGANVLNGTDANCTNWIKTYKDYKPAEGGAGGRRARRRSTRRATAAARRRIAAAAAAKPRMGCGAMKQQHSQRGESH